MNYKKSADPIFDKTVYLTVKDSTYQLIEVPVGSKTSHRYSSEFDLIRLDEYRHPSSNTVLVKYGFDTIRYKF